MYIFVQSIADNTSIMSAGQLLVSTESTSGWTADSPEHKAESFTWSQNMPVGQDEASDLVNNKSSGVG